MLSYILYVILIDKKIKTDSCADSGFKNDKIEFLQLLLLCVFGDGGWGGGVKSMQALPIVYIFIT